MWMTMYETENHFSSIHHHLLGKQTDVHLVHFILTRGLVRTTQAAFQLSKARHTSEGLQCVPSGNWTLQMHGSAVKKSLFSLPGVKIGGGGKEERGSLSQTPCQEGRTRAEQHHSRRKKTSAFQGGQP